MRKFKDIKAGDTVICFDEYTRDYTEHELKITNVEYNRENETETNPQGAIAYGDDVDYDEDEDDEDDCVSVVNERNFVGYKFSVEE